jgi:hypothetical protein
MISLVSFVRDWNPPEQRVFFFPSLKLPDGLLSLCSLLFTGCRGLFLWQFSSRDVNLATQPDLVPRLRYVEIHSHSWFRGIALDRSQVEDKVKLSRYRPGHALGVPGGWVSRISRQSAHEGGKAVSSTHRPSYPQEGFLVLISVRGWVDSRATMRPEGLNHGKIPVTPSGIEPATFRFVAQW